MKNKAIKTGRYIYYVALVLGTIFVMVQMLNTQAAEYNFYFNNTEQGDNSTANPSLTVDDQGKVKKNPDEEIPEEEEVTEDVQQDFPSVTSESVAALPRKESKRRRMMRLQLGLMSPLYAAESTGTPDGFFDEGTEAETKLRAMVSLGVSPLKYLGFNFFASNYQIANEFLTVGLELEVTPIHISLFGMEDALQIGGMGGYWSLAPVEHVDAFIGTEPEKTDPGSFFVGGRVAVNFGRDKAEQTRWLVATEYRVSRDYKLGNMSLGYRF